MVWMSYHNPDKLFANNTLYPRPMIKQTSPYSIPTRMRLFRSPINSTRLDSISSNRAMGPESIFGKNNRYDKICNTPVCVICFRLQSNNKANIVKTKKLIPGINWPEVLFHTKIPTNSNTAAASTGFPKRCTPWYAKRVKQVKASKWGIHTVYDTA